MPAIAWYRRTEEKQQADRRIRFLAHHDALTGLANRARLIERLEARWRSAADDRRHDRACISSISTTSRRSTTRSATTAAIPAQDDRRAAAAMTRLQDMVARLGGDEFVVVQTGVADKAQAEAFAHRIGTILSAPVYFREQEISPASRIGIALAPADGKTPERLLKSADLALYAGKAAGRNCIRFFSPEMDEAMQRASGWKRPSARRSRTTASCCTISRCSR